MTSDKKFGLGDWDDRVVRGVLLAPTPTLLPLHITVDSSHQLVRQLVNVVESVDWVLGADLLCVKCLNVLFAAVKVKAADGLAVVVVEENSTVALRVTHNHTL